MATYKIVSALATQATGASGKPYDVTVVDYLNENGEQKTQRFMKFKNAELAAKAARLSPGDVVDVNVVPDGKFFTWASWEKSTAKGPTVVAVKGSGERFDVAESEKQASIQRQVALKCAVDVVVGLKGKTEQVLPLADAFAAWLSNTEAEVDPADDLAQATDDDIPY